MLRMLRRFSLMATARPPPVYKYPKIDETTGLLQERLAMVQVFSVAKDKAYIKANDPVRAEMMIQRLWRLNYANFRNILTIHPINSLIDSFLQNHAFQTGHQDFDRAWALFRSLDKYKLKPDVTTFACFAYYFVKKNDAQGMKRLLAQLKSSRITLKELSEHQFFVGPIDHSSLLSLLSLAGADVSGLKKSEDDLDLLTSVLNEKSVNESEAVQKITDSLIRKQESASISSTLSVGVKLLEKSLQRFHEWHGESDTFKLQEMLEKESHELSLMEREEKAGNLPEYLRSLTGLPKTLITEWHSSMVPYIKLELKGHANSEAEVGRKPYIPFLRTLKPEQLAFITIYEFLQSPDALQIKKGETFGESGFAALAMRIGTAVQRESNAVYLAKKTSKNIVEYEKKLHSLHATGKLFDETIRRTALDMARRQLSKNPEWLPACPDSLLVQIGSVLAAILIQVAKIKTVQVDEQGNKKKVDVPAFFHYTHFENGKMQGRIKYNEELLKMLLKADAKIPPKYLPMLVPPKPWVNWQNGGYLTDYSKAEMVRIGKHPQHRELVQAADEANNLATLYHAIDVLGSTPWRINKPLLDVIKYFWNTKEEYPNIPSGIPVPEVPPLPTELKNDKKKFWEHKKAVRARLLLEQARYSQRCDTNYKILISDAVRCFANCQFKEHTIYFPHFLDFRGRAYPIPPYLNHIGSDLCRGLLVFDVAKPLGERGLRWLKIQIANLYGVDKVSFHAREQFVKEHMDEIIDSADNPIHGRRWWLKADSPYQCLATCIELVNAMRSPNPAKYLSRLPIHQDGTCNGLQHYAALGGDMEGAKMVNLVPGEEPRDIYSGVAQIVAQMVEKDAAEGNVYAEKLKGGKVVRKLVKQTVMTNTYGVTRIGARMQVQDRFKELGYNALFASDSEAFKAACYIVEKIFDGLSQMFYGARNLQLWLNHAAKTIANSVPVEELPQVHLEDAQWLMDRGLLDKEIRVTMHDNSMELEQAAAMDVGKVLEDVTDEVEHEDPEKVSSKKEPKESADKINKMSSVIWTTPLGLPVVQPYWNFRSKIVKTCMQTIVLFDPSQPCPVDAQKQSAAFPPNFVHSLDASHMMLSAIACKAAGLEFASVHDSYWTHAADVDKMNAILREAFVRLHSENLMERLRNELLERYKRNKMPVEVVLQGEDLKAFIDYAKTTGRRIMASKGGNIDTIRKRKIQVWVDLQLPPLPEKGKFDVKVVKDSVYFFH